MGCGVSQSVLRGNDDLSKSDAFLQLCTGEKNPIAMQLNGYFNSVITECLYKSQGDMTGYERLLAKRPTEITVNRSKLAAQRHGIGHKPLTVDGVNDIMNLFLGHVIKSLEKRKWSGTFNYALMQPMPDTCASESSNVKAAPSTLNSRNGSPQFSDVKKRSAPRPRKVQMAADSAASGNRSGAAAGDDDGVDTQRTAMPSSRKSKASAFSMPSSVAAHSSTMVFIDHGNGCRKDDDPSRQWRMELTGNITYPSVDGTMTLICDTKVAFLFFSCDPTLPAVQSNATLSDDGVLASHDMAPNPLSTPTIPAREDCNEGQNTNSVHLSATAPEPKQAPLDDTTEASKNSHTRIMSDPLQSKPSGVMPISAGAV